MLPFLFSFFLITLDNSPHQDLQRFFGETWSPYCKGNSLLECPSRQAQDLRDRIQSAYEQGSSFEAIQMQLEEEYGRNLRMSPEQGRGQLAYLIPWIAFGLCIMFIAIYWWKRKKIPVITARISPPLDENLRAELNERLR